MDPVMLAGVTLLQFMERVPDRVAAEHAVFHLGWKYALDLELTYGGFHPTVLVYFRDRLEEESVDPNEPAKVKGEPTDNFITEILTTEAAQGEMAGLAEALKRQQNQHEIKPQALYADGGYVTEKTLTEAEQSGMELLGPTRPDPHPGPYNADAFSVDLEKQQAICPQGNVSTQWSRIRDAYMGTEYYRIEWGDQCDSCPVQKQCTRSKSGRRILVVGLRHDLVEKRRKEMREAEFSKNMHPRNGIEGTHSELVRGHGLRRTKYRGLSRVSLSHYLMGAACNVKRYLNLLAFQMRTATLEAA